MYSFFVAASAICCLFSFLFSDVIPYYSTDGVCLQCPVYVRDEAGQDSEALDFFPDDDSIRKSSGEKPPERYSVLPLFLTFLGVFVLITAMLGGALILASKKRKGTAGRPDNRLVCPECSHKASVRALYCEMCGHALTSGSEKEKTEKERRE